MSAADEAASQQKGSARKQQALADESALKSTAQNNAQAQGKKSQRAVDAIMERGRIRAAIGDTGLEGVGARQLFMQSLFNEDHDAAAINANRTAVNDQIEIERKGSQIQTSASIQQADAYRNSAMIQGALGFAGTALGAASQFGGASRGTGGGYSPTMARSGSFGH
jgi:hypothetical protein